MSAACAQHGSSLTASASTHSVSVLVRRYQLQCHSQPVKGIHSHPVKGIHSHPVKGIHSQPVKGIHSHPVKGIHSQPLKRIHSHPVKGIHSQKILWGSPELVGQWCMLRYDQELYPGIILSTDETHVQVKCMHRVGPNRFFWPARDDILWYLFEDVLEIITPPKPVTKRHVEILKEVWARY